MNDFNIAFTFRNEDERNFMEYKQLAELLINYLTNNGKDNPYNKPVAFTLETIIDKPYYEDISRQKIMVKPFKIHTFEETLGIPPLPKKYNFKERIKILFTGKE